MPKNYYSDIDIHNGTVTGLRDASAPTEAVNKGQLDTALGTIDLSGYATDAELATEVTARTDGDTAANSRLDAISIVGDGLVVATETGDNQWTLNIDSIPLANTYTGPGTDSPTINADLLTQGVTPEIGDTYVNDASGAYFLHYAMDATPAALWKELAAAGGGVSSVNGTAGEIAVANPAGPSATVSIDQPFKDRIAALEAVSHAAANGSNAISVDAASQAISLLLDPASPELSQSATGLKVDLSAYSRIFRTVVDLSTGVAVVTHGLGTQFVDVSAYLANDEIGISVIATSATDVTLSATPNAALAAVNVVVIG